mgnify:CR=1 FL=1
MSLQEEQCIKFSAFFSTHELYICNGGWMQIEPPTLNILRIFILQVEDKFWLIPGVNLFSNYLQI